MWVFLAFCLLINGCDYVPPPNPPDMQRAEVIVWSFYGESTEPPYIAEVTPPNLNCSHDGNKPYTGFWGWPDGKKICLAGLTYLPESISVAQPGWYPWDQTALAHEYLHVHQYRQGILDPQHTTAEWQPGGLLDKANAELRSAGL